MRNGLYVILATLMLSTAVDAAAPKMDASKEAPVAAKADAKKDKYSSYVLLVVKDNETGKTVVNGFHNEEAPTDVKKAAEKHAATLFDWAGLAKSAGTAAKGLAAKVDWGAAAQMGMAAGTAVYAGASSGQKASDIASQLAQFGLANAGSLLKK